MARRIQDKPNEGTMDFESLVYGNQNLEDDEELMAELLALAGEDEQSTPAPTKPQARVVPRVAPTQLGRRQAEPSASKPPDQARPATRPPVDFAEIDRLTKQISVETTLKEDDDADVDDDGDLQMELDEILNDSHGYNPFDEDDETPAVEAKTVEAVPSKPAPPPVAQKPSLPVDVAPAVPPRRTVPPPSTAVPAKAPVVTISPAPAPSTPSPSQSRPSSIQTAPQNTAPTLSTPMPRVLPPREALEQRLDIYRGSVIKCQTTGDDRRARQNERIVKQFETALKDLARGKPIDWASLPTPVGCSAIAGVEDVSPSPSQKVSTASLPRISPSTDEQKGGERSRLLQLALAAKKAGDMETAKQLLARAKQLDTPPAPNEPAKVVVRRRSSSATRTNSPTGPVARSSSSSTNMGIAKSNDPKSPGDILRERERFFKNIYTRAQENGDERRSRQCRRVLAMYSEALSAHRKGAAYDYSSLPEPPGESKLDNAQFIIPQSSDNRQSIISTVSSFSSLQPTPPKQSRQEEQLSFLLHRQAQFKEAALLAKRRGDMEAAKTYLRQAKGFDEMIEGSRCGLRVDISATPVPPQARTDDRALKPQMAATGQSTVNSTTAGQTREELLATLEADLIRQIQLCEQNQEYFTRAGSVTDVQTYERMAVDSRRDLIMLRNMAGRRHVPTFYYETRQLPVLQANLDLADDELEVEVVRAVCVPLPEGYLAEHADLYVTYELGYPESSHQKGTTGRQTTTVAPVFNERSKLRINRKERQFLRYIKRHGIKFEIWQKTNIFKADRSLGMCELKLLALETQSTLHESMDLVQGRKNVGGKLEVKARIRQPVIEHQANMISQKWLVLEPPAARAQQKATPPTVARKSMQP